jgi:hypothetical protein
MQHHAASNGVEHGGNVLQTASVCGWKQCCALTDVAEVWWLGITKPVVHQS